MSRIYHYSTFFAARMVFTSSFLYLLYSRRKVGLYSLCLVKVHDLRPEILSRDLLTCNDCSVSWNCKRRLCKDKFCSLQSSCRMRSERRKRTWTSSPTPGTSWTRIPADGRMLTDCSLVIPNWCEVNIAILMWIFCSLVVCCFLLL